MTPGARPQGADRHYTATPVPREAPDLHKLAQALLHLAVDRAAQARTGAASPDRPRRVRRPR